MAAVVGHSSARNDSTLTTEWPKPFDIKNDIFLPGKVSTYKREMNAALATRGLLDHLINRPATMQEIATANPLAAGEEVQDMYVMLTSARLTAFRAAAPRLATLVKTDTLTPVSYTHLRAHET